MSTGEIQGSKNWMLACSLSWGMPRPPSLAGRLNSLFCVGVKGVSSPARLGTNASLITS